MREFFSLVWLGIHNISRLPVFFSFFGIGSFFRACVLDVCMFSLPCFTALAWKKKVCVTKLKSSHLTAVLPFSS